MLYRAIQRNQLTHPACALKCLMFDHAVSRPAEQMSGGQFPSPLAHLKVSQAVAGHLDPHQHLGVLIIEKVSINTFKCPYEWFGIKCRLSWTRAPVYRNRTFGQFFHKISHYEVFT